ncbi:MAG TPA: hypothetical protein VIC08_13350 [Cellvibrionaceae bacterium]
MKNVYFGLLLLAAANFVHADNLKPAVGDAELGICVSETMTVSVFPSGLEKSSFNLRLAGEDTDMLGKAQAMFGDFGVTSNSASAKMVLSVILREDGSSQISIQRYGSERVIEKATCEPRDDMIAVLKEANS